MGSNIVESDMVDVVTVDGHIVYSDILDGESG